MPADPTHHRGSGVVSQQMHDLTEDHELAANLANRAGQLLVELRGTLCEQGISPRDLGDLGDARSHEWLTAALAEARPLDAVLSEEATADETHGSKRLDAERVWIIDPLDGTREYSEGRPDWAVHVALAVDGQPVVGAVSLPVPAELYSTLSPAEVPRAPERLRLVVSRSRPPRETAPIAEALGAEIVQMGSAGAKAMSILRGEADLYAHSGGQYEWDSCAPVAVALAAGLHCSRLDGSALVYNQPDTYMPDLLICRPEHAHAAIEAARGPEHARGLD